MILLRCTCNRSAPASHDAEDVCCSMSRHHRWAPSSHDAEDACGLPCSFRVCVFVRQLISDSIPSHSFIALKDPVRSGLEVPPVSHIVFTRFALDVRAPYAPEEHVRAASHTCLFYLDQRDVVLRLYTCYEEGALIAARAVEMDSWGRV